jgi:hypothetical protein
MAVVMGLVFAAELHVEIAQVVAKIFPIDQNEGFEFSDLMIRKPGIRNGGHDLQTFDRQSHNSKSILDQAVVE